jgi:uncharacterized damage-inducible protein DinB
MRSRGIISEHIVSLQVAQTEAAAALQRAREAESAAMARFAETGTEEDRLARVTATQVFDAAKAAYDEARAAYWLASNPPECSVCRRRHGREVRHAAE